ncbi:MAG: GldG family protein [Xanthobacteraceae bacterium]|nr:GldG family protein [Xanthobacteraceae bacterium]
MSDSVNSATPRAEASAERDRRGRLTAGRMAAIAALLGAIIFMCVNIVSSQLLGSSRVDLTQQHLYSLSQGTRTLLGELNEPLRFRLFLSGGLTKQAPQLAAFAGRVRSMLDAYVAASNGHIVLEVIDPRPFSEDEDRAVAYGIQSFQGTGGEQLFFGLAATNSTTGRATINVFAPDREAFLEYDLTRLVSQLGNRGKPVVALIDGIGLAGSPMTRIPEQQTLAQMRQFFDVKNVAQSGGKIPDNTKVLMVVHPQHLDDATRYEIDQWVLSGKPIIVFVDPFAENQMGPGGMPAPDASSTLEPLFKAWGVTFDPTKVIGDATYALQTQRNIGGRPVVTQNLPWLALRNNALARDEAILAQLSAIVMTDAGSFGTAKDGITLRPLLTASDNAVLIEASVAADRTGDPRRMLSAMKRVDKAPVLAARLSGTLESAYPDGPPADKDKPATDPPKGETLKRSAKPVNVVLVGDADMLMDRNWIQQQSLLGQQIAQAFANNGDFVINAVEQMAGGAALSDLRGRGISWRPFELIQRMEAEADQRFRAKEQQLTQELKDTEQKLSQLPRAPEGSVDVLTPEQVKAIEGFRAQLLTIRSELRDVQFALRRNVDDLKNWITAVNVGVVPLLVAIIALLFAMRRPRRPVPVKEGPHR